MKDKYVFLRNIIKDHSNLSLRDVGILLSSEAGSSLVLFLREGLQVKVSSTEIESFNIEQTGDEHSNKVCDRCFRLLSTKDQFQNNRIKKHGKITKRPSCVECRKIKDGLHISKEERAMWKEQKPGNFTRFTCPICKKTTIAGITKVVLDHCHKTGMVRGWICESCNTGIGRFDDDENVVMRAVDWLKKK